jgi:hypothetical protein
VRHFEDEGAPANFPCVKTCLSICICKQTMLKHPRKDSQPLWSCSKASCARLPAEAEVRNPRRAESAWDNESSISGRFKLIGTVHHRCYIFCWKVRGKHPVSIICSRGCDFSNTVTAYLPLMRRPLVPSLNFRSI